jgi:hypothetical protein
MRITDFTGKGKGRKENGKTKQKETNPGNSIFFKQK